MCVGRLWESWPALAELSFFSVHYHTVQWSAGLLWIRLRDLLVYPRYYSATAFVRSTHVVNCLYSSRVRQLCLLPVPYFLYVFRELCFIAGHFWWSNLNHRSCESVVFAHVTRQQLCAHEVNVLFTVAVQNAATRQNTCPLTQLGSACFV